eukprot:m.9466 g.9466  ORF g.9466 m.9466 type:complete len:134 (-) comp4068_c0_seq2:1201-1602(-)
MLYYIFKVAYYNFFINAPFTIEIIHFSCPLNHLTGQSLPRLDHEANHESQSRIPSAAATAVLPADDRVPSFSITFASSLVSEALNSASPFNNLAASSSSLGESFLDANKSVTFSVKPSVNIFSFRSSLQNTRD